MIYRYRHLLGLPRPDVSTPVDGRWARAIPLPYHEGVVGRIRDAFAVLTGRAYAFRWPEAGEFEDAVQELVDDDLMMALQNYFHKSSLDGLVLGTVNASYRRSIDAATLATSITNVVKNGGDPWANHVATFFFEVKPLLIMAFADKHKIDGMVLRAAYAVMRDHTGERNAEFERVIQDAPQVA